jgi:hypothetical protein
LSQSGERPAIAGALVYYLFCALVSERYDDRLAKPIGVTDPKLLPWVGGPVELSGAAGSFRGSCSAGS